MELLQIIKKPQSLRQTNPMQCVCPIRDTVKTGGNSGALNMSGGYHSTQHTAAAIGGQDVRG